MTNILGYGEDALTFWFLKDHIEIILKFFNDNSDPNDCLVLYRPSFGRSGGRNSTEFGEFDAIVTSREKYYLIESKWDNHTDYNKDYLILRKEQQLRHEVFTWYLFNWGLAYRGNWQKFRSEQQKNLEKFNKTIPPAGSLLAINLESVLSKLANYCYCDSVMSNVRNVLLFFYNGERSIPPTKTNGDFKIIPVDYVNSSEDNFLRI
jgi:hypothetical protein